MAYPGYGMIECPYCEAEIREPEECPDEDCTYENECQECEKTFAFNVTYSKSFHPFKADCLNGAEHDYQPIVSTAPELHRNRCSMCFDVKVIKPE